ncbi:MAG: TPM domain-containing protein [Firmicutes bacterium]|nr:TPM domain-containing protein [Bacillota bacterium]
MRKIKMLILALVLVLAITPAAVFAVGPEETVADSRVSLLAENYIYDEAGIFTEEYYLSFQERAKSLSEYAQCGVYFLAVDDYTQYSSAGNMLEAAEEIYLTNGLGMGEERNGIFLFLSMDWRDYALVTYGDFANMAFTDYGQYLLCEEFLDDFKYDKWVRGVDDYIRYTEVLLEKALAGTPMDVAEYKQGDPAVLSVMTVVPAAMLSLVICNVLKGKMKTARRQVAAFEYIVGGQVDFRVRQDRFTHVTRTRRKINTNNGGKPGGGGTTIRSSGFSGRSGKF